MDALMGFVFFTLLASFFLDVFVRLCTPRPRR